MSTTDRLHSNARRQMNNMASYIRRQGVTGWVKERSVAGHYREIFCLLVQIEDAEGVEATAKLSDRFRKLTDEARDAGLLTPGQIVKAETAAIAEADWKKIRDEHGVHTPEERAAWKAYRDAADAINANA